MVNPVNIECDDVIDCGDGQCEEVLGGKDKSRFTECHINGIEGHVYFLPNLISIRKDKCVSRC